MKRGVVPLVLVTLALLVAIWLVTLSGGAPESFDGVERTIEAKGPAPAVLRGSREAGSGETDGPPADASERHEAPTETEAPSEGKEASSPVVPVGAAGHATLVVTVVDGQGRPRRGLRIRLYVPMGEKWVFTHDVRLDATGVARFDDAHPDAVYLWIDDRHAHRSQRLVLDAAKATEVEVVLPVGGTITGTTRHQEKGVLRGVDVLIEHRGGDVSATYRTRTDVEGRFRLEGVIPGTHGLGFYGRALDYHRRPRAQVVVRDGEEVHVDVVLGRVTLRGRVRDAATGDPVPEVRVGVGGVYVPTTTDASGVFLIRDLPPGSYYLGFTRDGYEPGSLRDVVVAEGAVREVEIALRPAGLLVLRFVTPAGKAVTGAVEVGALRTGERGERTSTSTSARTDGHGVVRWTRILPGTYTLTPRIEGFRIGKTQVEVGTSEAPVEVVCEPLPREGVPVLRGVVRDVRTRQPVAGVEVRHERGGRETAITDEKGAYALWRSRGTSVRLIVQKDGYGILFLRGVKVKDGETTTLDIELTPAAALHLWLTDANGNPVVGQTTLVIHPRERDKGWTRVGTSVTADAQGHAIYEEIVPGDYELTVIDEKAGRGKVDAVIHLGENVARIRLGP